MGLADQLKERGKSAAYYRRLQQAASQPMAKISGLISLTLLTIAFFGVFAILPTLRTIGKLNKQVTDAEAVRDKLTQKISDLEKAELVYESIFRDVDEVEKVLPEDNEFERLAWQIAYLANDKGVELVSAGYESFMVLGEKTIVNDKKEEDKEYDSLPFDLSVEGDYLKILSFLSDLNKIDRLLSIDKVNISSGKGGGSQVKMTINLTAYYLPSKTSAAAQEGGQ